MPQRWAMWLAVYGDLRFASHHDMMRVIERTFLRGNLPLKYSQGFSPRVIVSLAFPRPVGVAADRDLLVLSLQSDMPGQELLDAANRSCPEGLTFTDAIRLESKATCQPSQCTYEIPVPQDKSTAVARSIEAFSSADTFPIQRTKHPRSRNSRTPVAPVTHTLDLKLLIDNVRFDGDTLSWRQAPHRTLWAKPAEAMEALGLDPVGGLAMVTRTSLEFGELKEYNGRSDGDADDPPETK